MGPTRLCKVSEAYTLSFLCWHILKSHLISRRILLFFILQADNRYYSFLIVSYWKAFFIIIDPIHKLSLLLVLTWVCSGFKAYYRFFVIKYFVLFLLGLQIRLAPFPSLLQSSPPRQRVRFYFDDPKASILYCGSIIRRQGQWLVGSENYAPVRSGNLMVASTFGWPGT